MKRLITTLAILGCAASLTLAVGSPAAAHPTPRAGSPSATARQLALARAASARYHDVNVAIADGFVASPECAALPGVGAMGYHYVNVANILDGGFDVTKPEILLYAPSSDGPRLAGIEFFQPDGDQNLATDDDRPSLLGQAFNGPMPGHEAGMPIHYDLHVWLWVHNPDGMFAPWNPNVTCPPSGS